MNRLERLAGELIEVDATGMLYYEHRQAIEEVAAILLAASKVDVAGLMNLAKKLSIQSYAAGADNNNDTGDITEKEQAAFDKLETALRMALAVREPKTSGPRNVPTPPPMDACRPNGLIYELPPVVLNGYQLKEALEFLAPDDTDEQLEEEVCIALRDKGQDIDGHEAPRGIYCWLDEYPEEGSILLGGGTND